MTKSAIKDTFREGWRSLNRFISILLIIMIGVAFFVGIKSTAPSMKNTADIYYDDCRLSDLRVVSTLGLAEDDIEALRALDNVEYVQPGYFTDAVALTGSAEFVFRLHSIPTPISDTEQHPDTLNQLVLREGRLPTTGGECVIEASNTMIHGFKIGDYITVSSGTSAVITEETLETDVFEIVGIVETPYYLSWDKGASDIGTGSVHFFMYIVEDNFKVKNSENPYYIEANIKIKGADQLAAYTDEYDRLITDAVAPIENLGIDRSSIRLESVKKLALEEIAKEEATLLEEEASYRRELAAAAARLKEGELKIASGETELKSSSVYYAEKIADGEKQIEEARAMIADSELQIQQGREQLAAGQREYDRIMSENADTLNLYYSIVVRLNEAERAYNELKNGYEATINDPNSDIIDVITAQTLLAAIHTTEEYKLVQDLSQQLRNVTNGYDAIQSLISTVNEELESARQQIRDGEAQVAAAKIELADGEAYLDEQKKVFADSIENAEMELSRGQAEYDAGLAEYNAMMAEYDPIFEEGKLQIHDAKAQIELISQPSWIALDRNTIYSYVLFASTSEQIDSLAQLFPVFFFLVAILVCLTTMTRMVDDQRGVMGTYKALGYTNRSIFAKFGLYATFASFIGGALGAVIGVKIIPAVIFKSYSLMYTMPELSEKTEVLIIVSSIIIGTTVTVLAALFVCVKELKSCSAELMRPKAPKAGKPILLEKIPFIWNSFSFSMKVTMRNIFRYKKKFFMTVFGIMGCTALILAGLGLNNSITEIVPHQYGEIFAYNINALFRQNATDSDKDVVYDYLNSPDTQGIKSHITVTSHTSTISSGSLSNTATLMVCPDNNIGLFSEYITLRDRRTSTPYNIPSEGLVISEKLAEEMSVGVGDNVKLSFSTDNSTTSALGLSSDASYTTRTLKIAAITENYIGHYIYMSGSYFKSQFGTDSADNTVLIKLTETTTELERKIGGELIDTEIVSSAIYYTSAAESFQETVKTLNDVVYIIILFAGLLAFVVLYNLTNINIVERTREIATIKVLGFYDKEANSYVFRENILLSVIGSVIGLGVGIFLHKFIMQALAMDGIMFGDYIAPISFLIALLLTMVFTMVVNLFMTRHIKHIPMVESLKSVE